MGLNVAFVDVDQVTDGVKREKTDSERKRMRTDVNVRKEGQGSELRQNPSQILKPEFRSLTRV